MIRTSRQSSKINRMAVTALLSAAVMALQIISCFVKIGQVNITLALTPIIVGGALYGVGTGAFLGAVFGLTTVVAGYFGWDGGTVVFLAGQNAFATILTCFLKAIAAGAAAAAVYKAVEKASRNTLAATVTASVVCPVVNTAVFVAMMALFFLPTLNSWANGANMMYYVLFGLCGVNFLIELTVNLVLSSAVNQIIRSRRKQ